MFRSCFAAALIAVGLSSCVVLEPTNPQAVAAIDAEVAFSGLSWAPRTEIWIEAAPTPASAFASWPGARTTSTAVPAFIASGPFGTPIPLYPWNTSATIPADRWTTATDADGCGTSQTFVRVRDRSRVYETFDSASGSEPSGSQCFLDGLARGERVDALLDACASSESGAIRLETGARIAGDALLDTAADAAALRCLREITGTLTVIADPGETLSLPRLERVGRLLVTYRTRALPMPVPGNVCSDGPTSTTQIETGQVELPVLTTVVGDVALAQEGSGRSDQDSIAIGLDALASVGGDLSLTVEERGVRLCGLGALAELDGDLFMVLGEADFTGTTLLANLARVSGALTIEGGFSLIGVLVSLTEAGAVTLRDLGSGGFFSGVLPSLTRAGDVLVTGVLPRELLPALITADSLTVQSTGLPSLARFGTTPAPALALGALSLLENASLSALTGSRIVLDADAPLAVRGNPAAAAAEVCAFVAQQSALGWTGTADLGGIACPP